MHRLLVLVSAVALFLFLPYTAVAQTSLEVTFSGLVEPGAAIYPNLTTVGSWDTPCEPGTYTVYWHGSIDWGDGVVTEWRHDSGGIWMDPHAYDVPGRYQVTAQRSWRLLPFDEYGYPGPGEGDCVRITGDHKATTIIQVGDSNWTPSNGYLGVFVDENARLCAQPTASVTEMFVVGNVATLDGESLVGFGGAEFRVQSTGGLVLSATAMPGWISVGNPLGDGVSMARSCSQVVETRAAMLRITALAPNAATSGSVLVRKHMNPPNPLVAGPTLILCDDPTFTAIAAQSWHAAFVGSETLETCSQVSTAVDSRSWTRVKELYR